MGKRYLKPLLALLGIAALTAAVCALAGRWFPALESGAAMGAGDGAVVRTLVDFERDGETGLWSFRLRTEGEPRSLLLLSAQPGISLALPDPPRLAPAAAPQFYRAELDADRFIPQADGTAELVIRFAEPFSPESARLYVAGLETAGALLNGYALVFAFGMGVVFLMAVYALSLYRRKRSERYLAWFAAFTGSVFLWSLCSLPPNMPNVGFSVPFSLIYDLSAVLTAVVCFRICDLRPRGAAGLLAGWRGVLALMLLFLPVELLTPSPWPDLLRTAVYAAGAGGLVWACGGGRSGAKLLLAGYAVSFGLRLAMLSGILSLTHVNFLLLALRFSKLFNLPFAFCCLFFINRRFADKFTEAEALAMELEQANRTLDAKVEERTAALVRQQEQRRTFMTNVFHDLRTPLFILRGCTEDLRAAPEHLVQLLPIMGERLDFVGRLTEDLFLMAKLEDGKLILETERVPLDPVLRRVSDACRVEAEAKGVSLSYAGEACTVFGDELRLEQVFQNLIDNAIYYTPPGGSVEVALRREGGLAAAAVRDTGIGISRADQGKLFDRYYRVSGTDKHDSTGLGLSIAMELVRLHRGDITVKSAPGAGTVFTVTLPALE